MKYSICSTVYNAAPRLRASLDSILQYINPEEFEIVVVDSESTDGTLEILKEYANKFPNFKIIVKKCKRGKGRQIAFENSSGDYIIPVDLDTIYLPQWWELIKAYENWEGKGKYALQAIYSGIYPRHLLEKVGGWRNLQSSEDFDLWWRLIEIDAFRWTSLVVGTNWEEKNPEKRQTENIIKILCRNFITHKDRYIARSVYPLKCLLYSAKYYWSSSTLTYYFYWMPMEVAIYIYVHYFMKRKKRFNLQNMKRIWYNTMIDFPIEGKRLPEYGFLSIKCR